MQRLCAKCGHQNPLATGSDHEACPQCGAIYAKAGQPPVRARRASEVSGWWLKGGLLAAAVIVPFAVATSWVQSDVRQEDAAAETRAKMAAMQREAQAINIAAGRVSVGMDAADARKAWGPPSSVTRTTGAGGIDEQWIYRDRWHQRTLYLRDGRVALVQESE